MLGEPDGDNRKKGRPKERKVVERKEENQAILPTKMLVTGEMEMGSH